MSASPEVLLDIGGIKPYAPTPGQSLPARKQGPVPYHQWRPIPGHVPRHLMPKAGARPIDLLEVLEAAESDVVRVAREVVTMLVESACRQRDDEEGPHDTEPTNEANAPDDGKPLNKLDIDPNDKSEEVVKKTEGDKLMNNSHPEYIQHRVNPRSDSILGLSLAYGVSMQDIRRDNRLSAFNDNIKGYTYLRIRCHSTKKPTGQQNLSALSPRERAIEKLKKATGLSGQECEYYMSVADNDYDIALSEYKADKQWEEQNTKKPMEALEVEQPEKET